MIAAAHQTMLAPQVAPLPYDAEVEYLEFTGTQYVDTGLAPDNNTLDFSIEISNEQTNTSFQSALGCRQTAYAYTPASYAIFLRNSSGNRARIDIANSGSATYASAPIGIRLLLEWDSATRTLAQVSQSTSNEYTASQKSACDYSFILGGVNTAGTIATGARLRIYSATFSRAGVTLLDLSPVRVGTGSSAVGYLYDRANPTGGPNGNGLYGNAGSGSFTVGPDKT